MSLSRFFAVFSFSILLMLSLSACSRDPNARKAKYFDSGERYFQHAKYDEAAIQFLNAIKIDPYFAKAHYRLAETYIRLQAWADAYRELHRISEIDPDNVKAQVDLAGILLSTGAIAEAEKLSQTILNRDPNNAAAHALRANVEMAQGNRHAAVEELEKAVALDTNELQSYVQLAKLQSATDPESAELTLRRALGINPKFVPALETLAVLYQNTKRGTEAEKLLREAIELQPKDLYARQLLAQLFLSQNRRADAEQVITRAKGELGGEGTTYRILGEYYNSTGELDKATAEFAIISQQHPKDLKTKEDYIDLLLQQNKVADASKLNDEILGTSPGDTGARMLRGRILNLGGQYAEAINVLQAALKDAPEHAGGHDQLALAFSKTGDLQRAEQEWREAVTLEPRLTDAQLALAQIAIAKDDRVSLSKAAEQIVRNAPSDPRGYMLRADVESRYQQNFAAEADFAKAIQVAPQSPLAYAAMGGWLFKNGKLQDAQKYYELALGFDPNNISALNGLVAVFVNRKQNLKAIERVQQQITKAPDNDSFYSLLGGLQAANKDFAGAEKSLQKALQLNEGNLGAVLLLSNVERAQGSIEKALATAYQSIKQNPNSVVGYFLAGTLEDSRGNWGQAEFLYQQALRVEPNYAPAANNLAYGMLVHKENTDVALALAQAARQKMPDSPSAADTLAWIYYEKGVYAIAGDLLQEASRKAPKNATYHYHLGMVLQKQNKPAEARKQLERALQINPNHPDAGKIHKALSEISYCVRPRTVTAIC